MTNATKEERTVAEMTSNDNTDHDMTDIDQNTVQGDAVGLTPGREAICPVGNGVDMEAGSPEVNGDDGQGRSSSGERSRAMAQECLSRDWGVIPIWGILDGKCTCLDSNCKRPGKHPRNRNGSRAAIWATGQLDVNWPTNPHLNLGIVTGPASGVVILDVDPRHGGDKTLADLEAKYGPLPLGGPRVRTGSGGMHIYFKAPENIKNSTNRVGTGLDIRGEGGYAVAPPSVHACGGAYEWITLPDAELPVMPDWLVGLAVQKVDAPDPAKQRVASGQYKGPPPVFERIIEGCGWMRDTCARAAEAREEVWYAHLGIVGRCADGHAKAHEVSRPYPNYSREETDKKLAHALDSAGPRTCKYIEEYLGGAEHCRKCAFRGVSSPITLGHRSAEGLRDAADTFLQDLKEDRAQLAEVFDRVPLLAWLDTRDYGRFKLELKSVPGSGSVKNDLDRAVNEARTANAARKPSVPNYREADGGIVLLGDPGAPPVRLTNFTARIIQELVVADGFDCQRIFKVTATVGGRGETFDLTAEELSEMGWVLSRLGTQAVILPGTRHMEHARAAIQLLSGDPPREHRYGHTGWVQQGDGWIYLHGGGAITSAGNDSSVGVRLEDGLVAYQLPSPPAGEARAEAVRTALGLLALAPARVTVPLLAAVFRAPLGAVDSVLHIEGVTGTFKSELAAVAQRFFGPGFTRAALPGTWMSTANGLEARLHAAKDALFVLDDFAPQPSAQDTARLNRTAEQVIRGVGNGAARQRMRADTTIRASRPPRCLVLSTGEVTPPGASVRARMVVVDLRPGDVDTAVLTRYQSTEMADKCSSCMAAFVQWLASRVGEVMETRSSRVAELREELAAVANSNSPGEPNGTIHRRTAVAVADLALGLDHFLQFAVDSGAVSEEERASRWATWVGMLQEVADAQVEYQRDADPVALAIEALRSALSSGTAHVTDRGGRRPSHGMGEVGWQGDQPRGDRVGFVDGDDLFLDPVAWAMVMRTLGVGGLLDHRALVKHLKVKGLLLSCEESRGTSTVRRTFNGDRHTGFVHVARGLILPDGDRYLTAPPLRLTREQGEHQGVRGQVGQVA